jgi:hypothetical protein
VVKLYTIEYYYDWSDSPEWATERIDDYTVWLRREGAERYIEDTLNKRIERAFSRDHADWEKSIVEREKRDRARKLLEENGMADYAVNVRKAIRYFSEEPTLESTSARMRASEKVIGMRVREIETMD